MVPYGRSSRLRHVVGAAFGRGFESRGRAGWPKARCAEGRVCRHALTRDALLEADQRSGRSLPSPRHGGVSGLSDSAADTAVPPQLESGLGPRLGRNAPGLVSCVEVVAVAQSGLRPHYWAR